MSGSDILSTKPRPETVGSVMLRIGKYISLLFCCFMAILPIVSCVITAAKTKEEYQSTNIMTPPQSWFNFGNYIEAFQTANMGVAFRKDKRTLCTMATSLYTFTGPLGNQYNLICAGVIMSLLPALIAFLVCQKQIYSGVAAGAVKG